jgi:hypothetical protein
LVCWVFSPPPPPPDELISAGADAVVADLAEMLP